MSCASCWSESLTGKSGRIVWLRSQDDEAEVEGGALMSRAPSTFRESDLKRALRAIEAAGKKAASVEIEAGRIRIKLKNGTGTDNHDTSGNATNETNEWDEKYGEH